MSETEEKSKEYLRKLVEEVLAEKKIGESHNFIESHNNQYIFCSHCGDILELKEAESTV